MSRAPKSGIGDDLCCHVHICIWQHYDGILRSALRLDAFSVLYSEGFEAAIGQHYLWGFMLAMLAIYGPGSWSADRWLAPRLGSTRRW